jgi:hypothetical protein
LAISTKNMKFKWLHSVSATNGRAKLGQVKSSSSILTNFKPKHRHLPRNGLQHYLFCGFLANLAMGEAQSPQASRNRVSVKFVGKD